MAFTRQYLIVKASRRYGHIAFEVDDVAAMLKEIISALGSSIGELATVPYPDDLEAIFVYDKVPEENIRPGKILGSASTIVVQVFSR